VTLTGAQFASKAQFASEGQFRKRKLLVPIAGMTLGGITLVVLLSVLLITWFDTSARGFEERIVADGFHREVQQLEAIMVPQVNWDESVAHVDVKFSPRFADSIFSSPFYTFNGFTHTFIADPDDRVIYAAVRGRPGSVHAVDGFLPTTRYLLRTVRNEEARRPPIHPNPSHQGGVVTYPIQADGVTRINGTVYLVIASLVQPDFGKVLPKGPRAPVLFTAMPIDDALLNSFERGYQVNDISVVAGAGDTMRKAYFSLHAPDGTEIAALAWTPRQPGTALLRALFVPMLVALIVMGWVGWTISERSAVVVDELIASEAEALHLAYHDPLTHLPNRTRLFERIPEMLATIGPQQPFLALLCIDLDRFKKVNDTLGHQAGDALINAVAERLRGLTVSDDRLFAARLGGDEFVLLTMASTRAGVDELAQRCLSRIVQPVDSVFGRLDVGCSIGVSVIDNPDFDPSEALRQADLALYRSKANGRACVTTFDPSMDESLAKRRLLEAALRTALSDQAFHMVYQPQVDARGKIIAAEALVRWTHPTMGPISPGEFIVLAEESGLILAIGEWVMRRVFQETAHWNDGNGNGIRVAINVSAVQMRTQGFANQVVQMVAQTGIDPARYEIELTETALLRSEPTAEQNFNILQRLGFCMALDDFGTGYSSLSLLQRFRVDRIKIDQSFVADLGKAREADALVSAIIKLARTFRLSVIAEGVETEGQKRRLIAAGCREFQGYLTGLPMSAEALERALDMPPVVARRLSRLHR